MILGAHGVRVLRLRNELVLNDCEEALRLIACALGAQFHSLATQEGGGESPSPDRGEVGEIAVGRGLASAVDAAGGEGGER